MDRGFYLLLAMTVPSVETDIGVIVKPYNDMSYGKSSGRFNRRTRPGNRNIYTAYRKTGMSIGAARDRLILPPGGGLDERLGGMLY